MSNELQLRTGAYRTTFVGTEIIRQSTLDEWRKYGEILKRVDEAKQWAIGDWLCDGKRHYGDGLYKEAEGLLGIPENSLWQYKRISELFEFCRRLQNLTWGHHQEVASLKQIKEDKKGKLNLSDEPDKEKMQELLKKAEKEKMSVRELRIEIREYQEEQREYMRLANEPDKYSIIYADPPWEYTSGDQHTNETQETVIGSHYKSMPIEDICNFPIKNIASDNCVLFLWVTSPVLEEAFEVINSWGFKYKASMVWDKVKHNVGNFVSIRHEFLLICTRGQPPKVSKLVDSVYEEERTEHSKKPEYFRQLIDELYPKGKRKEFFARDFDGKLKEKYPHWDFWGLEI